MDNALWSTLLTLLTVLTCLGDARSRRRSAGVALLTGLLVLTRPEAVVWAPLFIAILTIRAWLRATAREALAVAALPLAAFALTLGGLTAFRLAYFGYPLPNTFYAKMSPALGYSLAPGPEIPGQLRRVGPAAVPRVGRRSGLGPAPPRHQGSPASR